MKLRKDEMDQLRVIRDSELNLPERWFTGKEWADGTAERVYAEDYRAALIEAGYEAPETQESFFSKWEKVIKLVAKQ
jgi:hypothetical protein